MGSVYDAFNLGNGYENVYTAIPGTAGGSDTVTDTLVTPIGDVNLDSLFGNIDAAAPLQPGDAFTGLEAGDSSVGADAFSIGGFTLDPHLRPEVRASTRSPARQLLRRCWRSAAGARYSAATTSTPKASTSSAAPVERHRDRDDQHRRGCHEPVGLDQHATHRRQGHRGQRRQCLGPADGGFGLRRVQPGQRVRERLHRHPRHRRR